MRLAVTAITRPAPGMSRLPAEQPLRRAVIDRPAAIAGGDLQGGDRAGCDRLRGRQGLRLDRVRAGDDAAGDGAGMHGRGRWWGGGVGGAGGGAGAGGGGGGGGGVLVPVAAGGVLVLLGGGGGAARAGR